LAATLDSISHTSEDLAFLKKKVEEKKEARQIIFKMTAIDPQTKLQLLKACSFDSEFLTLRGVAERIDKALKEERASKQQQHPSLDPLAVPGPFGPYPMRPPHRPFAPHGPGNIFGEPDADHLPPPGAHHSVSILSTYSLWRHSRLGARS